MNIIHYVLDFYFAAVLGVAGIAKINSNYEFISMLRYQLRFPQWSINVLGRTFPWAEIILAILLVITLNPYKLIIIICIFLIFLVFLVVNCWLYMIGRSGRDCGCYGKSLQRSGIHTSTTTSLIQFMLVTILMLLTFWTTPLPQAYYLIGSALLVSVYCWLLLLMWKRRRLSSVTEIETSTHATISQ